MLSWCLVHPPSSNPGYATARLNDPLVTNSGKLSSRRKYSLFHFEYFIYFFILAFSLQVNKIGGFSAADQGFQIEKPTVEFRNYFPETWLFDLIDLNDQVRHFRDLT
jgi:hypothetical protein